MITTLTYNDLERCTTEDERISFIQRAINEHEDSSMYQIGKDAGLFYRGIDSDLEEIKKLVYDRKGTAYVSDEANHKIETNLFFLFCTQLVAYQLGNGVSFDNEKVKEQLGGSEFDFQLQQALIYAYCDGESYGYVNEDGVTPLCFACKVEGNEPVLVPLKDEDDGLIKAAIRYWRLAPDKPLMVRLFELDGTTVYKEVRDENGNKSSLQLYEEKKSYSTKQIETEAEGVTKTIDEVPALFPIVPLRYIKGQSELVTLKDTLFAIDLAYSALANGIDVNTYYWIIKNADGMSTRDDLNFVADMIHNKVVHEPEGVEIRREKNESDYNAYMNIIATLRDKAFTDAMAVDVERKLAGNVTTVEIKAAYQNLNFKCDKIEKYLSDFIRGILRVKGIDENEPFHFKRPNDINTTEFMTMLMQIAPVIGEDTTLKLMCETLGLIDEYEEIKAKREAESMAQFGVMAAIASQGAQEGQQGGSEPLEV